MALETEQRQLEAGRVLKGVTALFGDVTKGTYFVAELRELDLPKIAGQLMITHEWSDWRNANFWWIQSVYVAKEYRGKGVFKALFNHVQVLARAQKDVCGLRLYMDSDNQTARRTYDRIGFKRTHYEMFEMDLEKSKGELA